MYKRFLIPISCLPPQDEAGDYVQQLEACESLLGKFDCLNPIEQRLPLMSLCDVLTFGYDLDQVEWKLLESLHPHLHVIVYFSNKHYLQTLKVERIYKTDLYIDAWFTDKKVYSFEYGHFK